MTSLRILVLGSAVLTQLAPFAAAQTVHLAGVADGFACPAEPANPSTALAALLCGSGSIGSTLGPFDSGAFVCGGTNNRPVAHTFTGLPSSIAAATLEMPMRASSSGNPQTDGILLLFADPTMAQLAEAVAYRRPFGPLATGGCAIPADPTGLLGGWTFNQSTTLVLDLAQLPLPGGGVCNLLSDLEQHGFLDVFAGDDTTFDYFRLTVTAGASTCAGGHVAYGTGLAGTGGATPRLVGRWCPAGGYAMSLQLSNALGGTLGAFVLGFSPANTPFFGGTLLVSPVTTLVVLLPGAPQPGHGYAAMSIDVPVWVTTLDIYSQAAVLDAAAPAGIAFSGGVQSMIR